MKCPHCTVVIQPNWNKGNINIPSLDELRPEDYGYSRPGHQIETGWSWAATRCPSCTKVIINIELIDVDYPSIPLRQLLAIPRFPERKSVDDAVPEAFRADYSEACGVLDISAKASAALSRRILQGILTDQGYKCDNLARQIDSVLDESDPTKVLPSHIRETVDAVRHFGNFAAHPITEETSLQIIDVEAEEAEWCLEIIVALFDHYYVTPARARERREQLNQKLAQAGRKPAKS